jgi:phosphatidylserine synthase
MFGLSSPKRRSLTVAAVAKAPAALDDIAPYLARRVTFLAVLGLDEGFPVLAAADAVLVYPDGFSLEEVQPFMQRLLAGATLALAILITSEPKQYRALSEQQGAANRLIVLAAPAWPSLVFATIQSGIPRLRQEPRRS